MAVLKPSVALRKIKAFPREAILSEDNGEACQDSSRTPERFYVHLRSTPAFRHKSVVRARGFAGVDEAGEPAPAPGRREAWRAHRRRVERVLHGVLWRLPPLMGFGKYAGNLR